MLAYTAYAAGTVTLTGTCQSNLNHNGNITLILPPELERNGSRISSFEINPYQYHNFTLYAYLKSYNTSILATRSINGAADNVSFYLLRNYSRTILIQVQWHWNIPQTAQPTPHYR